MLVPKCVKPGALNRFSLMVRSIELRLVPEREEAHIQKKKSCVKKGKRDREREREMTGSISYD